MKSIETQGKTSDQAIEIGLYKLGVTRDEVNIEILEQAGLFNKARVRISLNTSSPEEAIVKDLEKRSKWKEIIRELFESSDRNLANRYNKAIEDYSDYLEKRKEEYEKEYESIDRLFDTDLLRYIAKVLCTIKYKMD